MMYMEDNSFGIDDIIKEIKSGEYKKDILSESAVSFTGEHEALYFSNLRRNLQSDLAELVISVGQSLDDLRVLRKIGVV